MTMINSKNRPVIGIVSCQKELNNYKIQSVNEFYINAIRTFGGLPLLLSAGHGDAEIEQIISLVDGFLLPGSHSNIAPEHYGAGHHEPYKDSGRDQLSFSVIRQCADKLVPILGICRGFQEMNVVLGGSLHPKVHEKPGYLDHREADTNDFTAKYAHAHGINVVAGGHFNEWFRESSALEVNSLHSQGVEILADALVVEAKAPDGLIEAFSLPRHPYFVGVQWHPEWQAGEQILSSTLFKHFITSALNYRESSSE